MTCDKHLFLLPLFPPRKKGLFGCLGRKFLFGLIESLSLSPCDAHTLRVSRGRTRKVSLWGSKEVLQLRNVFISSLSGRLFRDKVRIIFRKCQEFRGKKSRRPRGGGRPKARVALTLESNLGIFEGGQKSTFYFTDKSFCETEGEGGNSDALVICVRLIINLNVNLTHEHCKRSTFEKIHFATLILQLTPKVKKKKG